MHKSLLDASGDSMPGKAAAQRRLVDAAGLNTCYMHDFKNSLLWRAKLVPGTLSYSMPGTVATDHILISASGPGELVHKRGHPGHMQEPFKTGVNH